MTMKTCKNKARNLQRSKRFYKNLPKRISKFQRNKKRNQENRHLIRIFQQKSLKKEKRKNLSQLNKSKLFSLNLNLSKTLLKTLSLKNLNNHQPLNKRNSLNLPLLLHQDLLQADLLILLVLLEVQAGPDHLQILQTLPIVLQSQVENETRKLIENRWLRY